MKRLLLTAAVGMLALMAVAGPVSARTFGAVYANDQIYRVFGNAANVPDGTGTDPLATFTTPQTPTRRASPSSLRAPRPAITAADGPSIARRGHQAIPRPS